MKRSAFCLFFVLLLVMLVSAGCVGSQTPAQSSKNETPVPVSLTPTAHDTPNLNVPLISVELANIQSPGFTMDPTGITYEFFGKVAITSGTYNSVKVILRYPDGTEYSYDAGGMGGSNATRKDFTLFPDKSYKNQTPAYFIKLDSILYSTVYRYDNGGIMRVANSDNFA